MDRWTPASSTEPGALGAAAPWADRRPVGGAGFAAPDALARPAWPPPPPEGRWRPADRFRSSHVRARWVYLGFWVRIPSLLLDAVIYPALMSALERSARGEYVIDDLNGLVDFSRFVSVCTIVGLVLTGVGFLAWLSRLTDNAPWLGVGMPSISPRGAILWWFVPVASFMKPYQSVGELQRRLAPTDAERRRRGRLVIAWWLTYLGGFALREIASVFIARADDFTTEKIAGPLTVALAGDLVWTASAVLTVVLVRRMERDAAARAGALGYRREDKLAVVFPGPAPAWYAQSPA